MKNNTFNLIKKLSLVLNNIKLVDSFIRIRQHYDEPKFWYYSASASDKHLKHEGSHFHSNASGVSFYSQDEALIKALAEAIERYNNFAFFKKDVNFVGKYSSIKKKALDPRKLIFFSDEQLHLKDYNKFIINDDSPFRWTKMKNLSDKKNYLVPCQAIYLSYKRIENEPLIYPSISTGAAGHSTLNSAILSGIYEILERDAFMIYYLNKLKPKRYDLLSSKNKEINDLIEIAERYHLEIYSLDIRTDLDVPVVASVVIDRSGLSKAVSVGLKCDLDSEKAIIGSINEAFHTRTWIRESYIKNPSILSKSDLIKDSSILNRGLFWYSPKAISKLDFFIKNLALVKVGQARKLSVGEQIVYLKNILSKNGHSVYYKDITSKYFNNIPFKVVKVIIPGMQPMYLNEKYPLQGGERLYNVPIKLGYRASDKLNTYPHPFL